MMRSFLYSYKIFRPLSEMVAYHLWYLLESRLYKEGSLIWAQNKSSVFNIDFSEFYSSQDSRIQSEAIHRALELGKMDLSSFQRILTTYSTTKIGKNKFWLIYKYLMFVLYHAKI